MSEIVYPETKTVDVVEERFGHSIADPYRWLESDVHSDEEVADWVEAQNKLTEEYLARLPGRDIFRERLAAILDYEHVMPPIKRGDRYFFTRNPGLDNQPTLFVREGADGADRVLIDPNSWSADNSDALAEWAVSDDGSLIAYGVQAGGTDWRAIRVMNVDTGQVLEDDVQWTRSTELAWASDGSGFFYSRYPEPEAGSGSLGSLTNHAVYFHKLGTPQSEDRLVHATPDQPNILHLAERTDDGRYLVLYSTPGSGTNALTLVDLVDESWPARTIVADFDAEWTVIGYQGGKLFVTTSEGAERRRIVTLDLSDRAPEPVEIVPEGPAVLTTAVLIGGQILSTYLVDAKTEVRRFGPDGRPGGIVDLPGIGSAGLFRGRASDNEAFYIFSSYDAPITIYRYDVAANRSTVWARPKVPFALDEIAVEQHFYPSKDGTEIPLFIVRRKGSDKPAPTMLYGYGGFGISLLPYYNPFEMAWVEQGGVLAIANIRGGGEYGRAWHRAGQFENKQNVFDDFIAAGEYLKAQGVTSEDGLAIQGESNGGLLVGAVVNQRPDLFRVAMPGVGVMDMLRYDQFGEGQVWTTELGSPAEERSFETLLAYSPYHNIGGEEDYPAILVTTADRDDRVVPGHSFKYTAALQAAELGPLPKLIRVETRAGHGGGTPLDKVIELYADMWTFAAYWTGLKVYKPD